MVFCLALGDGCLHYIKNKGKLYGGLTIDHGLEQADYQAWKASLLSKVFSRSVKVRTGHKGQSVQVSICAKKLRVWRKFSYPNGKKSCARMLKYIRHPELALAVWLADDGYVEPSFSTLISGDKVNYGARFRIFTCDQSPEDIALIIDWFKTNFNVFPVVKWQKTKGVSYPFLKFNQEESLRIWDQIREFILQWVSMRRKFRYIEQIYQSKRLQRVQATDDKSGAYDIVSTLSNKG